MGLRVFYLIGNCIYFGITLSHHPLNWHSLIYFSARPAWTRSHRNRDGASSIRFWFQYLEISLIFGFLMRLRLWLAMIGFSWKQMRVEEKWFYTVSAYFVVMTLAVALLGRDLGDYYHLINGSPRYTYLPRIVFLMMTDGRSVPPVSKFSSFFGTAHWILAALVLYINASSNILYKTDLEVGQSVRDFVAYLDQNQLVCAPGEERRFTLHRGTWRDPKSPGDWSIHANLCRQ